MSYDGIVIFHLTEGLVINVLMVPLKEGGRMNAHQQVHQMENRL